MTASAAVMLACVVTLRHANSQADITDTAVEARQVWIGKGAMEIRPLVARSAVEGVPKDAYCEYEADLLPDGSVASTRLNKSSGYPVFDEAVRRAVESGIPNPPDQTGLMPKIFTLTHYAGKLAKEAAPLAPPTNNRELKS